MTDTTYQYVRDTEAPKLPPPVRSTGVVHWLRANLFSSIPNTILTIVTVIFLSWLLPLLYDFLIGRAVFTGTMDDCRVETFGEISGCQTKSRFSVQDVAHRGDSDMHLVGILRLAGGD